MSNFIIKPLDKSTWLDFARLIEKSNGVWGGVNSGQPMNFHELNTSASIKVRLRNSPIGELPVFLWIGNIAARASHLLRWEGR